MESSTPNYDIDLKNLLRSWKLDRHYEHFQRENINIFHLNIMKSKHIDKLFQNLPIGDQILFEHHLEMRKMRRMLDYDSMRHNECYMPNQISSRAPSKNDSPVLLDPFIDDILTPIRRNHSEHSVVDINDTPQLSSICSSIPRLAVSSPRLPDTVVEPMSPIHSHDDMQSIPPAQVSVVPNATLKEPMPREHTRGQPNRYDLKQILTRTTDGQSLLSYYSKHQHLSERHRTALLNVIARYIDASGRPITLSESNNLEDQIVEVFPTEKLEFYRTTYRGKLYNKVANMKRIYRKINKRAKMAYVCTSYSMRKFKEPELADEYNTTRVNAAASGNFKDFWVSTQPMRLNNIHEISDLKDILERWPEYKEPNIMEYISMDFYTKYPSATKFSQVFNDNINQLTKLLSMKVNPASAAFKSLQNYSKAPKDSQHLMILLGLHQLLPPFTNVVTDDHGVKRKKRYSILDSQNASICIRNSLPLIDQYLEDKETATPPMLLVVGELGFEIQEVFVYFEGIRYPMKSVLQAAELCLQLFFVFNIDFPEESQLCYCFMQQFFLNIEPAVKNSKICTVIADLNAY